VAEARLPVAGESAWQRGRSRVAAVADRHPYVATGIIWAAWVLAALGVVVGGVESGAIADPRNSWAHYGGSLWPLFTWDYGWYHGIAITGYPPDQGGPQYAFFPLWPLLLRASGSIPDWAAAFALALAASGVAIAGVAAAAPSGRRVRAAAALACWPGSFLLLLAYPDVIALAAAVWAAALILRGRPWLAGILGAVAAVARPTGFLIAVPLVLVGRGPLPGRVFAGLAPLAGAGAVHGYFWTKSNDALAFVHAESLPIWARSGPRRLTKWPGHVVEALTDHAPIVAPAAFVAAVLVVVVARRYGRSAAAIVAYACIAAGLLLGAQTTQTRIQSAILALALLMLAVLVRLGPRYRPWAAFAAVVIGVSVFSGSVTSLGRQALFAFPLYWAVADGPRQLRHPLIALLAIAANIAYALTLAKYAP
jgi:hypothetical protein